MSNAALDAKPGAGRKRVFVKTYGCQMNVYDTARMLDTLSEDGFEETATLADADLAILNTCHIRDKATQKVYSEIGRWRVAREARAATGRTMTIAVTGCVAQAEGAALLSAVPGVDVVAGPQSYHRLPELLKARAMTGRPAVATGLSAPDKFSGLPDAHVHRPISAFVTAQEGCDKFCTFCVVPYTRGAEYSRPVSAILNEVRRLARQGAREISLLGQNVNAYAGMDDTGRRCGLAGLLSALCGIEEIARIRYTTSHPNDMTRELMAAHRDLPKVMPYLHLPFQSGSDRILRAMNRQHTREDYLEIIERVRSFRPDIALSTDIIVGFPGETDEDFEATIAVVTAIRFAQAYSFKYSPRPGTPAADLGNRVAEDVSADRLSRLQSILQEQQLAFNRDSVGKTLEVLWEGRGREDGQLYGRTPYQQAVHAAGPPSLLGSIAPVRVGSANLNGLRGVIESTGRHDMPMAGSIQTGVCTGGDNGHC